MSNERIRRRDAALDRIEGFAGGEPPRTREEIAAENQREYVIQRAREARERAEWAREREAILEQLRAKRRETVNAIIALYKTNQLTLENFNDAVMRAIFDSDQDNHYFGVKEFKTVLCIALAHGRETVNGYYGAASHDAIKWLSHQPQVKHVGVNGLNSDAFFLEILSLPGQNKMIFIEPDVSSQAFSEYLHSPLATAMQLRSQKITADMVKVFTEIPINQLAVLTLENCKFEDEATQKAFVEAILNYSRLEVLSMRECGLSLDQQFQIIEKANSMQWIMRLDKIELENDPRAKYQLLLEFERFRQQISAMDVVRESGMDWVDVAEHASSALMLGCVERHEKIVREFSQQHLKTALFEKVREVIQSNFLRTLETMMKDPLVDIRQMIQEIRRLDRDSTQVRVLSFAKEYLPEDKSRQLKNICAECAQLIRQPIPNAPAKEAVSVGAPAAFEPTVGQPVQRIAQSAEDTATAVHVLTQTKSASGSPVLSRVPSSEEMPLALPSVPKGAAKLRTDQPVEIELDEKPKDKKKEARQAMQLQ